MMVAHGEVGSGPTGDACPSLELSRRTGRPDPAPVRADPATVTHGRPDPAQAWANLTTVADPASRPQADPAGSLPPFAHADPAHLDLVQVHDVDLLLR
jgi:hypothetical protein